jgi:hypothetical protein
VDEVSRRTRISSSRRRAIIHLASVVCPLQFADVSQVSLHDGTHLTAGCLGASSSCPACTPTSSRFSSKPIARLRLNVLMNREPDAAIGALAEATEQKLITPPPAQ